MSKIARVAQLLERAYGEKRWPGPEPVLDELVRTILSQNTTAGNCDEAFRSLSERFPTWDDVRAAPWQEIAEAIECAGLANRRAPRIKRILEQVHERHGKVDLDWIADLPDRDALDYLRAFDGVGPKTAACVLMFGLGRPVLPVDTHVHRVATRLGLIAKMSAEVAHEALQALVPPELVYSLHLNMVAHGRQICHARKPECDRCALRGECDYFAEQDRDRR